MAFESNPRAAFKMSTEQERLMPPSGKPLIVHVVVNIEYWPYDQRPRAALLFRHTADITFQTCRTSAGRNMATDAASRVYSSFSMATRSRSALASMRVSWTYIRRSRGQYVMPVGNSLVTASINAASELKPTNASSSSKR